MKTTHMILCVMLDDQEHTLEEVVDRIGHLIRPEHAARMRVSSVISSRVNGRKRAAEARPEWRDPDPDPTQVCPQDAIHWEVHRALRNMCLNHRGNGHTYLEKTEGGWRLLPSAREALRSVQIASNVAEVLRQNLLAKGRLP